MQLSRSFGSKNIIPVGFVYEIRHVSVMYVLHCELV